jgi:hypothetical protein
MQVTIVHMEQLNKESVLTATIGLLREVFKRLIVQVVLVVIFVRQNKGSLMNAQLVFIVPMELLKNSPVLWELIVISLC